MSVFISVKIDFWHTRESICLNKCVVGSCPWKEPFRICWNAFGYRQLKTQLNLAEVTRKCTTFHEKMSKAKVALKLVSMGLSWALNTQGLSILLFVHLQPGGFVLGFVPLLVSGWPQLSQVSYPQTAASQDRKGDYAYSCVFKE